jgi:hypothetical protein
VAKQCTINLGQQCRLDHPNVSARQPTLVAVEWSAVGVAAPAETILHIAEKASSVVGVADRRQQKLEASTIEIEACTIH